MSVACTSNGTLVVTQSGALFEWGWLSDSLSDSFVLPSEVPCHTKPNVGEPSIAYIDVEGNSATAYIDEDGNLYLENYAKRVHREKYRFNLVNNHLFHGEKVALVACGSGHTLLLTRSYNIFELYGDLIDCPRRKMFLNGKLLNTFLRVHMQLEKTDCAVGVACGLSHSAIWTKKGQLYTYGDGDYGALGHNNRRSCKEPTRLAEGSFGNSKVVKAVGGDQCTLALGDKGEVWVWGKGKHGRLGLGDTANRHKPTKLASELFDGEVPHTASMGGSHTMILTTAGVLWGCGNNRYGQLGVGSSMLHEERHIPVRVDPRYFAGERVSAVCTGQNHTVAVTANGDLYEWSHGTGDYLIRNKPATYTDLLAPPLHFETGASVKFKNLQVKRELNGVIGFVSGLHNGDKRRFVVTTSGCTKLVKSENIAYCSEKDALSRPRRIPRSVFGNEPVKSRCGMPACMALALAMGTHVRLGVRSPVSEILPELVIHIADLYRGDPGVSRYDLCRYCMSPCGLI